MIDLIEKAAKTVSRIAAVLPADDFAVVPTSRGLSALIDPKFEKQVMQYRWYANITGPEHLYAVADIGGQRISLQRLIRHYISGGKSFDEIKQITFKNKCSLDCRASNLIERIGRQSVMRNRRGKRNTASKFKGVRRRRKTDGTISWGAFIRLNDGDLFLGRYEDERYAAEVYDAAAFLFFEGSGFLNFPDRPPNMEAVDEVRVRYERFKLKLAREMRAE